MGAGSTCFHNLKGAWLKLHFFNNACKDNPNCGVQGLQFGGGRHTGGGGEGGVLWSSGVPKNEFF